MKTVQDLQDFDTHPIELLCNGSAFARVSARVLLERAGWRVDALTSIDRVGSKAAVMGKFFLPNPPDDLWYTGGKKATCVVIEPTDNGVLVGGAEIPSDPATVKRAADEYMDQSHVNRIAAGLGLDAAALSDEISRRGVTIRADEPNKEGGT